jgi:hypothetical protein
MSPDLVLLVWMLIICAYIARLMYRVQRLEEIVKSDPDEDSDHE